MFKPSPILTMTFPNGETHLERLQKYDIKKFEEALKFVKSPEIQEIIKKECKDFFEELKKLDGVFLNV